MFYTIFRCRPTEGVKHSIHKDRSLSEHSYMWLIWQAYGMDPWKWRYRQEWVSDGRAMICIWKAFFRQGEKEISRSNVQCGSYEVVLSEIIPTFGDCCCPDSPSCTSAVRAAGSIRVSTCHSPSSWIYRSVISRSSTPWMSHFQTSCRTFRRLYPCPSDKFLRSPHPGPVLVPSSNPWGILELVSRICIRSLESRRLMCRWFVWDASRPTADEVWGRFWKNNDKVVVNKSTRILTLM